MTVDVLEYEPVKLPPRILEIWEWKSTAGDGKIALLEDHTIAWMSITETTFGIPQGWWHFDTFVGTLEIEFRSIKYVFTYTSTPDTVDPTQPPKEEFILDPTVSDPEVATTGGKFGEPVVKPPAVAPEPVVDPSLPVTPGTTVDPGLLPKP